MVDVHVLVGGAHSKAGAGDSVVGGSRGLRGIGELSSEYGDEHVRSGSSFSEN